MERGMERGGEICVRGAGDVEGKKTWHGGVGVAGSGGLRGGRYGGFHWTIGTAGAALGTHEECA